MISDDESGMVEMGAHMSVPELFAFLARQDEGTLITGAACLPCGHFLAFLRIYGHTAILNAHCTEEQAVRLVKAASAMSDVMDEVVIEQGGEVVNELPIAKEIFDIAEWPDSSDA